MMVMNKGIQKRLLPRAAADETVGECRSVA